MQANQQTKGSNRKRKKAELRKRGYHSFRQCLKNGKVRSVFKVSDLFITDKLSGRYISDTMQLQSNRIGKKHRIIVKPEFIGMAKVDSDDYSNETQTVYFKIVPCVKNKSK